MFLFLSAHCSPVYIQMPHLTKKIEGLLADTLLRTVGKTPRQSAAFSYPSC